MPFPLTLELKVRTWTRTGTDRNGDPLMGYAAWRTIKVFGWAVSPTQEVVGDSLLRTIDTLTVYCAPQDDPGPGGEIRTPQDPTPWKVKGNDQNYENNPFFDPGLVVVTATRTEG
ncbi:hypothetical protein [Corynebacterium flavescens]|uniref:hypothetical protein n=1 Tax=Corynebacterium flavescens TaxID=28028 RepID=UPI0028A08EF9|nr:hypothetical protein [Corynebacterium flavescens]